MPGDELAFFTSAQLIQELMQRTTFYGCIVHAAGDHRGEDWQERLFHVHCGPALSTAEASRLLETISERIDSVS